MPGLDLALGPLPRQPASPWPCRSPRSPPPALPEAIAIRTASRPSTRATAIRFISGNASHGGTPAISCPLRGAQPRHQAQRISLTRPGSRLPQPPDGRGQRQQVIPGYCARWERSRFVRCLIASARVEWLSSGMASRALAKASAAAACWPGRLPRAAPCCGLGRGGDYAGIPGPGRVLERGRGLLCAAPLPQQAAEVVASWPGSLRMWPGECPPAGIGGAVVVAERA
jgi:hypothetical protein